MTMGCTGRTCGSIKMWDTAGASFTMAVNVLEWGELRPHSSDRSCYAGQEMDIVIIEPSVVEAGNRKVDEGMGGSKKP